ncbi:unnamed protein product [Adineta ricciae]|uniref:Kinesin motor domain-containing protein n=3 Tax=Adineta ricciae TaxID=249248 RepID=A0A814YPV1_ADIRI|nr:unnamed protein product [Adineta ricciae]
MTKCLLKALKAVDLQNYVELFRSLGYDSAGALAHFHKEHMKYLHLSSQELLRFHALLDVLKEATREGKICPHYSKSHRDLAPKKSTSLHASTKDSIQYRSSQLYTKKTSDDNLHSKRSASSLGISGRVTRSSTSNSNHANGFILQRPASAVHQQKSTHQQFFGPKSITNRPAVEHVKAKSYNYGVPTNKRQRNVSQRIQYQHESNNNNNHAAIFVPSTSSTAEIVSYAKPAEIYVYARKRPLLLSEIDFYDTISVPDNKRIVIAENKANVDCTSLLKKTEFQFDQVFGSDASNKQVFESSVLPFLASNHRQNLTYICFGQTGSGKSHTIFGSRGTDGLLIHCTQFLLKEINLQNKLICSFYEIYNNQVYDLSNTSKRLYVREDGEHHVNIVGLTEIQLRNLDTLRSVISDGLSRRHHGKSAFNSNSSRSHAIFQLLLKNSYNQADYFRLIFIDLAGSERATDAQNNQRQTRREGAQINSSLLALKECIRSMDMTQTHAPFRQSKLTHILRDSLVGSKSRTCLMANVSPPDDCCQCSLNTLQYASRIRDLSIRHRHRSMPLTTIQTNYFDDERHVAIPTGKEKTQRTFKPATASTPVHRLISSVDHETYMSTDHLGNDTRQRTAKSTDINWQLANNDVPLAGNSENLRSKSLRASSSREFLSNLNHNNNHQSTSFYLTRYEQSHKKSNDRAESPSSYFPLPQSDIKKPTVTEPKRVEQWKTVPAPPVTSTRRFSDSSTEPITSTRVIPIAPIPMSDDNQYSSATNTESLGTKITKLATGVRPHRRSHRRHDFVEKLNLNKQSDVGGTTTTVTADTEPGIYSDRQATHRDQTGFFSNRDEHLHENHFKSNYLTTITQASSPTTPTPKNTTSVQQKPDVFSSSSRKSFSSPNKVHRRHQPIESSSSSSSLSSTESKKDRFSSPKRRHRTVPYHSQNHHSDSDDFNRQHEPYSNRKMSVERQEHIDDQLSDLSSNNFMQAPLDQIKRHYTQTLSTSTPYISPIKDYGIHVSDQLNTLRTLLETRLNEQDDGHYQPKDSSILQSSPGTFTKDFLQSYQQSKGQTYHSAREVISDVDNDTEVNEDKQTVKYYEANQSDVLSTSAASSHSPHLSPIGELNQSRLRSSATVSSTTTITPNSIEKTYTHEPRALSTSIYSQPLTNKSFSNNHILLNDSEHRSDILTRSPNPYPATTGTSSSLMMPSSPSRSPILASSLSPFGQTNGKSSSLLSGTSFDVLMTNLRSMREKDLDLIIHNNTDDNLIQLAD